MTDAAKEKRYAYTRRWRAEHREHVKLYNRQWALTNKNARTEYRRKYRAENREALQFWQREYYKTNWPRKRIWQREYRKNKWKTDPSFRIKLWLGNRIRVVLRGKKNARTMELIGCSIDNLWIYLESKFEPGMTRENYGKVWHVDHIMPCAIFDLNNPSHQKRCFHFSNLQPLFALDNRVKGSRITTNQFTLL